MQFDPFGELVDQTLRSTASRPVSRWLTRSGVGVFWGLVVVVLAARVAYFDPDFETKFNAVAQLIRSAFG